MRFAHRSLVRRVLAAAAFVALSTPPATSSATAQSPPASGSAGGFALDWSGVEAFWPLHATLARDVEPTPAEWDALFSTPGYRLLEAKERRRAALVRAFRLAYMPSRRAMQDSATRQRDWTAMVLPHLRDVPVVKDSLAAFRTRIEHGRLFERARALAQEYLPRGVTERIAAPPVSLLYFKDGRGYERILIDPLHLMRVPDALALIGHELHHYYHNRIAGETRDFGSDLLAWAIVNVETEGVACLVDKSDVPGMSDSELERRYRVPQSLEYFRSYRTEYARSNEWLRFFEALLERIADHPDSAAVLGRQLHGELPDNGRAMGAFMSRTIIDVMGHDRLLDVVGDPYAFWRRYSEAARRTNGASRALSEKALGVIDRVRDTYLVR